MQVRLHHDNLHVARHLPLELVVGEYTHTMDVRCSSGSQCATVKGRGVTPQQASSTSCAISYLYANPSIVSSNPNTLSLNLHLQRFDRRADETCAAASAVFPVTAILMSRGARFQPAGQVRGVMRFRQKRFHQEMLANMSMQVINGVPTRVCKGPCTIPAFNSEAWITCALSLPYMDDWKHVHRLVTGNARLDG